MAEYTTFDFTFICNSKQQLIKGTTTIQNEIYVKLVNRLQMVHSHNTVHRLHQRFFTVRLPQNFTAEIVPFSSDLFVVFKCYFLLIKTHSIFLAGFFSVRQKVTNLQHEYFTSFFLNQQQVSQKNDQASQMCLQIHIYSQHSCNG